MQWLRNNIPNFLTLMNLVCGIFAIFFCFAVINGGFINYYREFVESQKIQNALGYANISIFLLFLAMFFDLLDGLVARILKAQSEIGAQLDSLADMVSFGVAPSFLILSLNVENNIYFFFLPAVFAAIRLAKFNVDTEQTYYFKGMPTPAATFLVISIAIINLRLSLIEMGLITLIVSLLMVIPLKMFSFKTTKLSFRGNEIQGSFILVNFIALVIFMFADIPFIFLPITIMINYIFLSLIYHFTFKNSKNDV